VLVEEQQLRTPECGHEQSQGLALSARKPAHPVLQPVFEAEPQEREFFPKQLSLGLVHSPPQARPQPTAVGQGKILLDTHGGAGSGTRILKDSPDTGGPAMLRPPGDVHPPE